MNLIEQIRVNDVSIDGYQGTYQIENPEWVRVVVDSEEKVLAGIKSDGTVEWSVGVPTPVREFVETKLESISSFLDNAIIEQPIFSNKKVSIIGDSISTFVGYIPDGYPSWYPHENDRSSDVTSVNDTWWKKLIDATGSTLEINASYNGSTASNLVVGFSSRVSLIGSPDVIFIALGTNDSANNVEMGQFDYNASSYDLTKFAPSYIKGIRDTIATYPNARIICLAFDMSIIYQDAIKTIAEHYGLEYIYVGDVSDVHPNKVEMQAVYEKIYNFLTLIGLLNEKTDKEYGKSLIPILYIQEIDNPEYIQVTTDEEDKIIIGIKENGAVYIPILENDSIDLKVDDAIEKIDASVNEVLSNISAVADYFSLIDDPEGRSEITTDSDEKIVSYRDKDGMLHENVGINANALLLSENGISDFQKEIRKAGFNKTDWTFETSMNIPTPRLAHLNIISNVVLEILSKEGMSGAVEGVNYNVPIIVEFYDGLGNYFKKYALLSGQGRSSLAFKKKGLGLDFFNEDPSAEEFDEDNTFKMKFGDWVYQDSFHCKSYYTDFPRATTPVVYQLTNEVMKEHGLLKDRAYKKYYIDQYSDSANSNTQSELKNNIESGARCIPDGFPIIVYRNGVFWGVNSFQLKKHRDNYQMNKKKANHIHLDGYFGFTGADGRTTEEDSFFTWNGNINWTRFNSGAYGIEIRNPKNLYCVDGKKYNADTHDVEIIDTTTAESWIQSGVIAPTGKSIDDELAGYLRTTGKVRKSIEDLTTFVPTIWQMTTVSTSNGEIRINSFGGTYSTEKNFSKGTWVKSDGNCYMSIHMDNIGNPVSDTNNWFDVTDVIQDAKEKIEEFFDVLTFIDYILISNVIGDTDSWNNNTQFTTWGKLGISENFIWSGQKYDCDVSFGCPFNGTSASAATNVKLGNSDYYPLYKMFWTFFYDELSLRYSVLRRKGIFNAEHIISLFRDWMERVGYDNYDKEYTKWPDSPCFRDGSKTYPDNPVEGGFYGSIYRIYLWLVKRIEYMDASDFFNYSN